MHLRSGLCLPCYFVCCTICCWAQQQLVNQHMWLMPLDGSWHCLVVQLQLQSLVVVVLLFGLLSCFLVGHSTAGLFVLRAELSSLCEAAMLL